MTIRVRRRVEQSSTLEEMTDEELEGIYFFGYVMTRGGVVTYWAESREEQYRAGDILRERGYLGRDRRRSES